METVRRIRQKVEAVLNQETAPVQEESSENSILQGMNILVAEDNEINSEILGEVLGIMGATCDIYESGELVVDAFAKSEPGSIS